MNTSKTRQKVLRMQNDINGIALNGKPGRRDYMSYLDQILSNNQLDIFTLCMETQYGIDISKYNSFNKAKNITWQIVLERTSTPLVEMLRILYKSRDVYQQGNTIFQGDNQIGTIDEVEVSVGSDNSYLYRNKNLDLRLGITRTFLEVSKPGYDIVSFMGIDSEKSEMSNLLARYTQAIDYLLS